MPKSAFELADKEDDDEDDNMVKLIYAVLCYDNVSNQGGLSSG